MTHSNKPTPHPSISPLDGSALDEYVRRMTDNETPLEMVQRHIRQGVEILRHQHDLVQHLEATHSPLADEARVLLSTLDSSQADHKRHLARIELDMQSGRRDADGNLQPLRPSGTWKHLDK